MNCSRVAVLGSIACDCSKSGRVKEQMRSWKERNFIDLQGGILLNSDKIDSSS